jgi:SAM-dependent methyltransferase
VRETICIDWNNTRHINAYLDYTGDLNKALPFANASFDSVIFTDVLEHLAEPLSAIREIARVLRPGGTLIAGVPFFYRVHEGPHDFYRYTEFALRRFCKLSGLSVLELTPYGGLPEILVDLTSKGLEFLPGVIASVLRPFHTATCVLCKTPAIRKLSWWTRESFPLGYVLVANRPLTFDE